MYFAICVEILLKFSFHDQYPGTIPVPAQTTCMHNFIDDYFFFRFAVVSGSKGHRSRHPSKVEATNYYMSRARYSPLSSGRSKDNGSSSRGPSGKVAFGSSAPRWPQGREIISLLCSCRFSDEGISSRSQTQSCKMECSDLT